MAPTTCCGREMLVEDGMRVCETCGKVVEDVRYDHGRNDMGVRCSAEGSYDSNLKGTKRSRTFQTNRNVSTCRWKKVISNAADALRLNHEKLKEVNTLFEKAYYHHSRSLICKQERSKRGLCGACLYVACQQDSMSVPFPDICNAVQAEKSDVFQALKALKTHLGTPIPYLNRFSDDCVQICLKKYGLDFLHSELRDGIQQILKSLEGSLLETGFQADPYIISAAFLAWQRKFNSKATLEEFRRKSKTRLPVSMRRRLPAMRQTLYKMALEVPWIQKEMVTKLNAVNYLDDISKFQRSHSLSHISSDSDSDGESELPALKKVKSDQEIFTLPELHEKDSGVALRNLECEELTEEDIPDSELSKYIYLDEKKPDLKSLKRVCAGVN